MLDQPSRIYGVHLYMEKYKDDASASLLAAVGSPRYYRVRLKIF